MHRICVFSSKGKYVTENWAESCLAMTSVTTPKVILWSLLDDSPDIEGRKREIKALKRAFLRWAMVIPVKFSYVADITHATILITVSHDDEYFKSNKFAIAYAYLSDTELDIVFN